VGKLNEYGVTAPTKQRYIENSLHSRKRIGQWRVELEEKNRQRKENEANSIALQKKKTPNKDLVPAVAFVGQVISR